MLGLHAECSLNDIEENFKLLMDSLTQMEHLESENRKEEYAKKFDLIMNAYADAKTYKRYHNLE